MAKSGKNTIEPNWHPDFRITESLPDIKVVRTTFLVNFIMISVALVLAMLVALREVNLISKSSQISQLEQDISQRRADNTQAIRTNKEYQAESALAKDVATFYENVYDIPEIFKALSNACPDNIYFQSMAFSHDLVYTGGKRNRKVGGRTLEIKLGGVMQGRNNDDVTQINDFRTQIQELDIWNGKLKSISIPEPKGTAIPFQFEFNLTINLKQL